MKSNAGDGDDSQLNNSFCKILSGEYAWGAGRATGSAASYITGVFPPTSYKGTAIYITVRRLGK